jgi:fluoride exporter
MKYALIAVCGGAGSLARYLVGTAVATQFGAWFPWGTVAVNVTGSFLIGLIMAVLTDRVAGAHPNWRFALVVGFLGGYTTFSSFEWETYATIRLGGFWLGIANVVGSVVLGYAAVWLGATLVRR